MRRRRTGEAAAVPDDLEQRAALITAEFSGLDDWLDRYRYLVELGDQLPRLTAELRTEANRLRGCQYALWLVSTHDPHTDTLRLQADSDARIARGLAALVLRVLDGQPPALVANAELTFLDTLGVRTHLSTQRGSGLDALIHEIRRRARHYLPPEPT